MPEDGRPSESEIEDQLQRMLASDRFRVAEKRSEFLEFVVRRAKEGKKSPGSTIAQALFPDKVWIRPNGTIKVESHDVRETAKNLRKTLKLYYAEEGREDRVIVSLPEPSEDRTVKLADGEAYTPRFSYGAFHPVSRELRLGSHFHRRGTVEDERTALRHFAKALAICPDHIDAAIGVIEAWCGLLANHEKPDAKAWDGVLLKAEKVLDAAWMRGSKNWRLYAVVGNRFYYAGGSWVKKAAQFFAKAKALDPIRTESYEPYIRCLIDLGNVNEALALSKRYLDAHEEDSRAYVNYVLALAAAKRYGEIEAVLDRAVAIDRSDTFVQYYLAQLRIRQKRRKEAFAHIELMKLLLDHRSFGKAARELEKGMGRLPDRLKKRTPFTEPARRSNARRP